MIFTPVTHNDSYINLSGLQLPFTFKDVFTDLDYEILDSGSIPKNNTVTKHFAWEGSYTVTSLNSRKTRPASVMGIIHSKELQEILLKFFKENFDRSVLSPLWRPVAGSVMLPVTILKFNSTSQWHKEGYNDFIPKIVKHKLQGRFNYAFNFPFYGVNDSSYVEFASSSERLKQTEISIFKQFNDFFADITHGITDEKRSLRITRSTDTILDIDEWKDDLVIDDVRYGNLDPYVINLCKYHKVTSNDSSRAVLRFMGNNKYTFQDMCNFLKV